MSLELSYNLRHLMARRSAALLTVAGIALVVLVFVATLMLAEGLRATLAATGSERNALFIRNGAQNEIQSGIPREDVGIILSDPGVARLSGGEPIASSDTVVVTALPKRANGQRSNVTLRGLNLARALEVREAVRLASGRLPLKGTQELMVGSSVQRKFLGADIGDSLRLTGTNWPIVGVFDAGNSGFSSEIWGDADILMPAFRREQFSSVTFRLTDPAGFEALKQRLEGDRRLSVVIHREGEYYESQSRELAAFIRFLGIAISIIFSAGAVVGAIITMYSAVAGRKREIGVLKALGFSRLRLFRAFMAECMLISATGGAAGVFLALLLTTQTVTTTNFQTFAELSFRFAMTPTIAAQGLLFAVAMGFIGGALPALRAARLNAIDAIRTI